MCIESVSFASARYFLPASKKRVALKAFLIALKSSGLMSLGMNSFQDSYEIFFVKLSTVRSSFGSPLSAPPNISKGMRRAIPLILEIFSFASLRSASLRSRSLMIAFCSSGERLFHHSSFAFLLSSFFFLASAKASFFFLSASASCCFSSSVRLVISMSLTF